MVSFIGFLNLLEDDSISRIFGRIEYPHGRGLLRSFVIGVSRRAFCLTYDGNFEVVFVAPVLFEFLIFETFIVFEGSFDFVSTLIFIFLEGS